MDFQELLEQERSQRQVEIGDVLQQLEQERSLRNVDVWLLRREAQEVQGKLTSLSETVEQLATAVNSSSSQDSINYLLQVISKSSNEQDRGENMSATIATLKEELASISVELSVVKNERFREIRERELTNVLCQEEVNRSTDDLRKELSALSKELSDVKLDTTCEFQELRDAAVRERAESTLNPLSANSFDSTPDIDAFIDCKQLALWQEIEILGQYAVLSEARQADLQKDVVQAQTQQLQFGKMLDVEMGMVADRTNEMRTHFVELNGEIGQISQELTRLTSDAPVQTSDVPVQIYAGKPKTQITEGSFRSKVGSVELLKQFVREKTSETAVRGCESQAEISYPGGVQETDPAKLISRLNALRESMSKMEARENGQVTHV